MAVSRTSHQGFTLIELMVTIAIAAILLTIGVPSLTSFFDRQKVVAAAEVVYSSLQEAKIEAISRSEDVAFVHSAGSSYSTAFEWAISTKTDCSLSANDCKVSFGGTGVLNEFNNSAFVDVFIKLTTGDNPIIFDSTRGVITSSNAVTFDFKSPDGLFMQVKVSKVGMISLCSPSSSVGGYKACS